MILNLKRLGAWRGTAMAGPGNGAPAKPQESWSDYFYYIPLPASFYAASPPHTHTHLLLLLYAPPGVLQILPATYNFSNKLLLHLR